MVWHHAEMIDFPMTELLDDSICLIRLERHLHPERTLTVHEPKLLGGRTVKPRAETGGAFVCVIWRPLVDGTVDGVGHRIEDERVIPEKELIFPLYTTTLIYVKGNTSSVFCQKMIR
jgi:hypothetical protein